MRRLTWLSLLLLVLDQATKALAQVLLEGRELLLVDGFGLTYVTNPGVWIWPTIPPAVIVLVHTLALAGWVAAVVGWRWYRRWYRDSLAVDFAVAALAVTAFGNLIDRLLVGAARDWWVTPIAIANLADNTHWLALAATVWELWRFPPARRLARPTLHLDPRRWAPPVEERPRAQQRHERRTGA